MQWDNGAIPRRLTSAYNVTCRLWFSHMLSSLPDHPITPRPTRRGVLLLSASDFDPHFFKLSDRAFMLTPSLTRCSRGWAPLLPVADAKPFESLQARITAAADFAGFQHATVDTAR